MAGPRRADHESATRLVALLAVRDDQALFVLTERRRWRAESGYTLMPLELPGGAAGSEEQDEDALKREVRARLGTEIRLLPTPWTYAPSSRHAIDRRPVPASALAPLAETQRLAPADSSGRQDARPFVARIYRGEIVGTSDAPCDTVALWLAPEAIHTIVRGVALADVLARPDVHCEPASTDPIPEDGLVYLPSDYGERYLLRAAAKYGTAAIFGPDLRHADGKDAAS